MKCFTFETQDSRFFIVVAQGTRKLGNKAFKDHMDGGAVRDIHSPPEINVHFY